MTGSGSMGMVAPNSDGVSRPALTGQNQSIKTIVQRYQAFRDASMHSYPEPLANRRHARRLGDAPPGRLPKRGSSMNGLRADRPS